MKRYRDATVWVADLVEPLIVEGKLNVPTSTFESSLLSVLTKGQHISPTGERLGFGLKEDWYRAFASSSPDAFDAVACRCAEFIRTGQPIPIEFSQWVADLLEGKVERPKVLHRPRNKDWKAKAMKILLVQLCKYRFNLALTRNDETSHSLSGCDAVAEAFSVCGLPTKYHELKRLMVHPDYAKLRDETNRFWRTSSLSDVGDALFQLGLGKS